MSSLKIKGDKILESLTTEIDLIAKKEALNSYIKTNFNAKKQTDNKKVVFLNNPNWNIVTNVISGIHKSLNVISNDKFFILSKFDFKLHNKIEMKAVYSNTFKKIKFKDYAPFVFEDIRR